MNRRVMLSCEDVYKRQELLSVVIQVTSFKATGKRVFRMSPLHHHFELGGMKETNVVLMFWCIGLIFAVVGLWLGVL